MKTASGRPARKALRHIAIDPHRRAMRQNDGDDMTEDDHRRLAQPDDPHRLAMVEEAGGDVDNRQGRGGRAAAEWVVQRDKHILAVDQKRGKVMRGVVGQRDGQDRRREKRQKTVLCPPPTILSPAGSSPGTGRQKNMLAAKPAR